MNPDNNEIVAIAVTLLAEMVVATFFISVAILLAGLWAGAI